MNIIYVYVCANLLLGYDYWAEVTGCAEVDECTDPNYTSASS